MSAVELATLMVPAGDDSWDAFEAGRATALPGEVTDAAPEPPLFFDELIARFGHLRPPMVGLYDPSPVSLVKGGEPS